jgi:hypothetical protein
MKIEKAVRRKAKFLGCLYGFSGSGKTYSALRLAKGISGKIGLIDTEKKRSLYYADDFDFNVIHLDPPFTPERYIEALENFEKSDVEVIIIDSISHEWDGIGGCIDISEEKTKNGYEKTGLVKWAKPKMRHKKLMNKLLQMDKHVIICGRAKEIMEQAKINGKTEILNKGFKILQEKSFGYEMFITIYMNNKHPILEKCPKGLLPSLEIKENEYLSEKHGEAIAKWLDGGIDISEISIEDLKEDMFNVAKNHGTEQLRSWYVNKTKKERDLLKSFCEEAKQKALEFDNSQSKTAGLEEKNAQI